MYKPAKRKTFSIKWLLDHVNTFNATSADHLKVEREGKNMLLETILIQAGAYRGFTHLLDYELSNDAVSVGVREQREDGTWNFDDTDHTRVRYFEANGL